MALSLTPERWLVVKAAFAELADLGPAERAARLAEMTFGEPELRGEVEALLAASDSVGDRFERAPVAELLPADEPMVGQRVGPYLVVREIGQGGMGTVYEAHRADDAYRKRVALKMVTVRSSEAILRRFRHERQILARLEHRNIAALLDGGVTATGQPYFAMEYVEGERIDRYCASRRLGIEARLKLFRQVCAAVHYAHQNLVVHRDLKPSNILVAGDGTVKLLDFGIAKLVDPESSDGDGLTQTGVAPMTTAYASPEQLLGQPVTTMSDCYSLGVVLYELLTGTPPFPANDLPVLEARRRTIEASPIPPSRAVSADTVSSTLEPTTRRLQRALAGELDNIVMMALRKEPDRRYPSVEALSEDLLRLTAGLPIHATPDSFRYRIGKLIRRNRLAAVAAAVALLAVGVGAGASVWQARRARAERDRAEVEKAKAQQVTEFFNTVFKAATPAELGRSVTVVQAIDAAIPTIDARFGDRLWLRAAVKGTLGSTLFDMGLLDRAEPLLREALVLQRQIDSGRTTYDGATALYDVAMLEERLGHPVEAESLYRQAMAMYEAVPDIGAVELAQGWGQVANLVSVLGRRDEAIALQRKVMEVLRDRLPKTNRSVSVAIANYASNLSDAGRLADAEPYYREALALQEAAQGPNHPDLAMVLQPYSINRLYAGEFAKAESLARRAARIATAALGPTNPATLAANRALINVLIEEGRCDVAEPLARSTIAVRGKGLSDGDLSLGSAYVQLASCLERAGDYRGALAAVDEGSALRAATLPGDHWARGDTESIRGGILVALGDRVAGERALTDGYRLLERQLGADHYRTKQARERLAKYYRLTGQTDRLTELSR